MGRDRDNNAPELDNDEQADDGQAQDVAEDAMHVSLDRYEPSTRGGHSNRAGVLPEDQPDLIDKMEQMLSSGIIDEGAFQGEPAHDDEEDTYGGEEDDDA